MYKILSAGFAIFAMFFGAGNLIYPINAGVETSGQAVYSALGICLTGILLPLLSTIVVIIVGKKNFFESMGKNSAYILVALITALVGPFGALPRCITVAFGGFSLIFPEIEPIIFNFVFSVALFIIVQNSSGIVDIIGKFLTPALIIAVIFVIFSALFSDAKTQAINQFSPLESFNFGLFEGYQTMDMLVTPFFASIILAYFSYNKKDYIKLSCISSAVGLFLLMVVYLFFVYIGQKFSLDLQEAPKEQLFILASSISGGKYTAIITSVAIILACFTTAAALLQLTVDWANENTPLSKFPTVNNASFSILVYIVSLLGFSYITNFLGIVLYSTYPAFISLALGNMIDHYLKNKYQPGFKGVTIWIFWGVLCLSVIYNVT